MLLFIKMSQIHFVEKLSQNERKDDGNKFQLIILFTGVLIDFLYIGITSFGFTECGVL